MKDMAIIAQTALTCFGGDYLLFYALGVSMVGASPCGGMGYAVNVDITRGKLQMLQRYGNSIWSTRAAVRTVPRLDWDG